MPDSVPRELAGEVARWRSLARERPAGIRAPGPGHESVWDYPRPPRVEPARRVVRVECQGVRLAHSTAASRVCETAGPPVYCVPRRDLLYELEPSTTQTLCEWKGVGAYWAVRVSGALLPDVAWSYRKPFAPYQALTDAVWPSHSSRAASSAGSTTSACDHNPAASTADG